MKCALLSFALASCALAAAPSFQDIAPSQPYAYPQALSADGSTVVGSRSGTAFRWNPSTGYQDLLLPAPVASYPTWFATGVSSDGHYVAGYANGIAYLFAPIRWNTQANTSQVLETPSGYTGAQVHDLSDDGSIAVGNSGSISGNEATYWDAAGNAHPMGFLGTAGGRAGLAYAVSGNGQVIVGNSTGSTDGLVAFRWTIETGMVSLGRFNGLNSTATTVSRTGNVIAGYGAAIGKTYPVSGWVWTSSTGMQPLGDLPGGPNHSYPRDTSADGSIIIGQSSSSLGDEAFIWDASHGLRNLKSVLISDYHLDVSGWMLRDAEGISADGLTITGYGETPAGEGRAWIVTLPEPSTALLLIAMACVSRRRRRTSH